MHQAGDSPGIVAVLADKLSANGVDMLSGNDVAMGQESEKYQ